MTTKQVKINTELKMYVIPCGPGHSTWGFKNCFDETMQLALRLKRELPKEEDLGTMKVYDYHIELIKYARESKVDLGTWFNIKTPNKVKEVLEEYRNNKKRIRVFLGDWQTGRSWLDEYDVIGTVGRSMGVLKIPLLIGRSQNGGPGILDSSIVKLMDVETKRVLYQHPKFYVPNMRILPSIVEGYVEALQVQDVNQEYQGHANFKKPGQAQRLMDFLNGRRMAK
jgi:hypothetical protein